MDGLEYGLVVKWGLKGLMQSVYGWVDVSEFYVPEVDEPPTPYVWTSFMTGAPPGVNDVKLFVRARWDFLEDLRWRFSRYLPKALGEALNELGWRLKLMTLPNADYLRRKGLVPVFDMVRSVVIDFPVYCERLYKFGRLLFPVKKDPYRFAEAYWRINRVREEELLNALRTRSDWDLLAVYFDLADCVGHRFMASDIGEVRRAYQYLDGVAEEVRGVVGSDAFVLIVSDHGMDSRGRHSLRSFYSFSHDIPWRPRRVYDFKPLILKVVLHGLEGLS